jgi:four helix bundle protein
MDKHLQVKSSTQLTHHGLRVYHEARTLAALVHHNPPKHAELRNQAQRASISVVLNIAEAAGLAGAAKKRHFRIARGSVIETVAAYEVATDIGEALPLAEVTRRAITIASMLSGLIR